MKTTRQTFIRILIAAVCITAALYLAPFLLNRYIDLDTYKTDILTTLEKSLGRKVLYETGEFSLSNGLAFSFTNLVIKEKDGTSDFITSERVNVKISILHLLDGNIVLTKIKFLTPFVSLIRYPSNEFNISDLLSSKEQSKRVDIRKIFLSNATIRVSDQAITPEAIQVTLVKTDIDLDDLASGNKADCSLTGIILASGMKSPFSLSGTIRLPDRGKPVLESDLNIKLHAKQLMPALFWPYYSKYLPFSKFNGMFDIDLSFKGKGDNFSSSGKISVTGLRLDYPQVFHAVLTPNQVNLDYDIERTPTAVKLKSVSVKVENLKFKGSCDILDIHTTDPRIRAKASSLTFRLEEFRAYIPYGIIVKDTADFIEQHVMGGMFRLDEGTLDGKISQILHMEKDENYNVLYIRARVEQGLITYGSAVPTFNSIKGRLELKGKDFILTGMKARFGISPFSLEGRITDYPLNTPSAYPFSMEMHPMQPEAAWLMGRNWGKNLSFTGDSTLRLIGNGFTSSYSLSGDWNLTNAEYSYGDLIKKPAGRTNSTSFSGVITKKDMKLTSLRYTLSPLVLMIAAHYRYSESPWLGVDLKTNPINVSEIALMIPKVSSYHPTGMLQVTLHGESPNGVPAEMRWRGNASMTRCSVKPKANIKPLSEITGNVTFTGDTMETSQLSMRVGTSAVQGKGSMSGFQNPSLKVIFSSQLFDPADIGFISPPKRVKIANIAGNIYLKGNELSITSLSGQVNNTDLSLKGVIHNLHSNLIADLTMNSKYLDIDDILLLASLETGTQKPSGTPPTVKASINADAIKGLFDITFAKAKGSLVLENRILYLQQIEASLADGSLTGTVRIDAGQTGPARRFQVAWNLHNASSEKLLGAVGFKKHEIKGNIDLLGEISAKGETADEIKRTALGSVTIKIEEGTLKRLSVLSKIFSILNVSQLMKFQLPDMVSGGMPFNEITGSFSIKDGIVTTSDLYVASDAMNISTVGSYNLYQDHLDATIGVKPLQTIDKVVSRIPIVGWILTGKEKTLLTAYFESKGKLENPHVTAIPVKSMTKGVFDIFRRIFELPAMLVTDTGEVITGK